MPGYRTRQSRFAGSTQIQQAALRGRSVWLLLLLLIGSAESNTSQAAADEGNGVRITPRQKWSTVFGGSKVTLRFDVAAEKKFDGVFRWSFSANGRTIEAGESIVQVAAGRSSTAEVPLRVPPVKEGVIFPARLSVTVGGRGQEPIASLVRPITIFPRNPFFNRSKWLEELSISLFDPQGETAEVFKKAGIPFERIRNAAALDTLDEGLLIVGEGVSFSRHKPLARTLTSLAARGVPVLCLAPRDGKLLLPINEEELPHPNSMTFRRNDAITKLDKRLDAQEWMSDAGIAISRIKLSSDRGRVVGQISDSPQAWPWLELEFHDKSTLVYCGFGIIKRWDDGPTPRFLTARLFEHLTDAAALHGETKVKGRKP